MKRLIIIEDDKMFKAQDYKSHTLLSAKTKDELEFKLNNFCCKKIDEYWYLPDDYLQAHERYLKKIEKKFS